MKRFYLVDCNNFFVSCERVFNPALYNKPVVVLSSGDACIIARSNEAKALGIPMGAALFEYAPLIKKHNVIVYSANFALYGDMSARVMQTLGECASEIEVYSVDESFLHVSDYNFPVKYDSRFYYTSYGHHLKNLVKTRTGIPVSIGIGPTKTLAKISVEFAKKNKVYDGVFDITERPDKDNLLQTIDIKDVWGIGWRYSKKLQALGIKTAYDFMGMDDAWVRKNMTINGLKTLQELRGIACLDLEDIVEPKQSICVSRLFGEKLSSIEPIKEALAAYVSTAARKVRDQKSIAQHISVFIVSSKYHDPHNYYNSTSCELPLPTSYTPTLIEAAHRCLDQLYKPGFLYKKVGVVLSDLVPADCLQLSTYEQIPDTTKQSLIMKTIDVMNSRWGRDKIFFAAAGTKQFWKMKQTRKSQCYTTSWHELLTIKL